MSKSLLIGAVRRVSPAIPSDVARRIVESFLETIGDELVSQGTFTLQNIGALTLRQIKTPDSDDVAPQERDPAKRVPGVTARYHASPLLADRVRQAVRDAHRAAAARRLLKTA